MTYQHDAFGLAPISFAASQPPAREFTSQGVDIDTDQQPTYRERCSKCGGSGRRYRGECFACKGVGYFERRTSPDQRQAARQYRENRKQRLAAEVWEDFARAQPDAALWINLHRERDTFAQSMHDAVLKWGQLTERQLAAVIRNVDRARQDRERVQAAPTVDASKLTEAFDRAGASGLRRPTMRFAAFTTSKASDEGHNAGAIYCKRVGGERTYLGKIMGGRFLASRECTPEEQQQIVATMANPLGEAIRYARLTGGCSICGKQLVDPISVARGIGPICAERFGL